MTEPTTDGTPVVADTATVPYIQGDRIGPEVWASPHA